MKINFIVRMKNPWFWVGLIGTIFASIGVNPEIFTSWDVVWDVICALFKNPFQLCCAFLAVLGVFIDPTTAGLNDSSRAMTYKTPNKDK